MKAGSQKGLFGAISGLSDTSQLVLTVSKCRPPDHSAIIAPSFPACVALEDVASFHSLLVL